MNASRISAVVISAGLHLAFGVVGSRWVANHSGTPGGAPADVAVTAWIATQARPSSSGPAAQSPSNPAKPRRSTKASPNSLSHAKTAGREGVRLVPIDFRPAPRYPESARLQRLEGQVWLEIDFDEDGRVRSAQVFEGSGHDELDQAALETVREWQMTSQSGRLGVRVPIRFVLRNG